MLERFPWLDFTGSQVHDAFNVTLNNAAFDPELTWPVKYQHADLDGTAQPLVKQLRTNPTRR